MKILNCPKGVACLFFHHSLLINPFLRGAARFVSSCDEAISVYSTKTNAVLHIAFSQYPILEKYS